MLDEGEFVVAIHLIQRRLCGFDIPESIESHARPKSRPLLVIKQANQDELDAYGNVFGWLQPEDDGLQNSKFYPVPSKLRRNCVVCKIIKIGSDVSLFSCNYINVQIGIADIM